MFFMTRQSHTAFDWRNAQQLRVVGTALCHDLEREVGGLERGGDFAELNDLYQSIYQPKAIGLVLALVHYVPSGDPRIAVSAQTGEDRHVSRSDDLETVSQPLQRYFAGTLLKGVLKSLRELLAYLPQA
jgi:hypothetical protein